MRAEEVLRHLSRETGLPGAVIRKVLDAQARIAVAHADEGVPISGLGTVRIKQGRSRHMVQISGREPGKVFVLPGKIIVAFKFNPGVAKAVAAAFTEKSQARSTDGEG